LATGTTVAEDCLAADLDNDNREWAPAIKLDSDGRFAGCICCTAVADPVLPEAALFRLGRFPFPLPLRTSAHRLTLRQMSSFTH
jgi:hypothetical protein